MISTSGLGSIDVSAHHMASSKSSVDLLRPVPFPAPVSENILPAAQEANHIAAPRLLLKAHGHPPKLSTSGASSFEDISHPAIAQQHRGQDQARPGPEGGGAYRSPAAQFSTLRPQDRGLKGAAHRDLTVASGPRLPQNAGSSNVAIHEGASLAPARPYKQVSEQGALPAPARLRSPPRDANLERPSSFASQLRSPKFARIMKSITLTANGT